MTIVDVIATHAAEGCCCPRSAIKRVCILATIHVDDAVKLSCEGISGDRPGHSASPAAGECHDQTGIVVPEGVGACLRKKGIEDRVDTAAAMDKVVAVASIEKFVGSSTENFVLL